MRCGGYALRCEDDERMTIELKTGSYEIGYHGFGAVGHCPRVFPRPAYASKKRKKNSDILDWSPLKLSD